MSTKETLISALRWGAWPFVVLVLGWRVINLFSPMTFNVVSALNVPIDVGAAVDVAVDVAMVLTAIIAVLALVSTHRAGVFDRTPSVLASGTFIISTKNEENVRDNKSTNDVRDDAITDPKSIHTLQLVNVGRGLAKNVIPSKRKEKRGEFLEAVCPHSFSLPAGKGTGDLGEVLRVHGENFKKDEEGSLEFDGDNTAYLYIDFEDHSGETYKTKVRMDKVWEADGGIEELRSTPGVEVWKVMDNKSEKL